MKRELTCIICPRGCTLTVEYEENNVNNISGNGCNRGIQYAKDEITNPMRTLTTTVKTNAGTFVSVKTAKPVPKTKITACMTAINRVRASLPLSVGDVVLKDVCGTGVDVIATQHASAEDCI